MRSGTMLRSWDRVDSSSREVLWLGWLIPFAMISPMVEVAGYGIGAIDMLVWMFGGIIVLRNPSLLRQKSPVFIYLWLFYMGWCLASLNGLRFDIGLQIADYIILYRLGFCFLAWWLGYHSLDSIDRVVKSRLTFIISCVAFAVVVSYGLLEYADRLRMLSFFSPDRADLHLLARSARFPGIGQGANIYAFFPTCLFIFSFRNFVRNKSGILIPLLCAIVIFSTGSRKSIITLAFAAILIFFFASTVSSNGEHADKDEKRKRRNRLWVGVVLIVVSFVVMTFISEGVVSERGVEQMSGPEFTEDVQNRFRKWSLGMRRVFMSPLLGIPEPTFEERSHLGYFLAMRSPHNEFIQIWMWYGFLGLLAHIYLLGFFLWRNIQYRMGITWYLFYIAVIFQMMVDTAFKSYQFSAVFFMIAGYNWKLIRDKQTESIT